MGMFKLIDGAEHVGFGDPRELLTVGVATGAFTGSTITVGSWARALAKEIIDSSLPSCCVRARPVLWLGGQESGGSWT